MAARRHEVARAEAILTQQKALRELKTAQVFLSSRTMDPVLIRDGFDRGQAVLDDYGIGTDAEWAKRSRSRSCPTTSRRPCGGSWVDCF